MKLRNSLVPVAALLVLSGCGKGEKREEVLFSLGSAIFLLCIVAYGLHVLIEKLGSADWFKRRFLDHPLAVRVISITCSLFGAILAIYGFGQEGRYELFALVGMSVVFVGVLLPRAIDREGERVNLRAVSIFAVCIYVLLFLIFMGDVLFETF
ncbi:MAG: hypothetical protein CML13_04915 [Puniceicoccaceae bacterium]|nr:hypothetical protein [Puniceicoccaceae bacterium]|tara:strand:+ start:5738 stop:6196 length:459 start_codon:yes stop_codon:yes gene_type:complete